MSVPISFALYTLVYIISTSILLFCQKVSHGKIKFGKGCHRKHKIVYLLPLLAGIPVIMMSTFRYGIGTDFDAFYYEYQWCAKNINSYDSLMQAVKGFNDEVGLIVLIKLGDVIFHSFQGFLFLASLLTVIPVIIAFIIFDSEHTPFCFLIYLLTLFPSSFNGIHQHIAVSLSLLAIVLGYKNCYIRALMLILAAMFFHKTAFITIACLVCIKISRRYPTLKLGAIILIACGCLIAYRYLIGMLIQIPSFSKYAYAFNEEYGYSINYLIMHLALKIPFLMIILLFYHNILQIDRRNMALICYVIMDFLGVFLAFHVRWAMRLQYYTLSVAPLISVSLFKALNRGSKKNNIIIIRTILIAIYIFRFVILYGVYRYDEIIPYSFVTTLMK